MYGSPGSWTTTVIEDAPDLRGAAIKTGAYIVVGAGGSIYKSVNFKDWSKIVSGVTIDLNGVVWNGAQFVAVGNGGTILSSAAGDEWKARISGTTKNLKGIVWAASKFVAVGDDGTILISNDGEFWSSTSSAGTGDMNAVAGMPLAVDTTITARFVAVGNGGVIRTSADGTSWTHRVSGTMANLYAVVWTGKNYIAAGDSGAVLASPDGVEWTLQDANVGNQLLAAVYTGNKIFGVGYDVLAESISGISCSSGGGTAASSSMASSGESEEIWSASYGTNGTPVISADGKLYTANEQSLVSLRLSDGTCLTSDNGGNCTSSVGLSGKGRDLVLGSVNRRGRLAMVTAVTDGDVTSYMIDCFEVNRGPASGPWPQYGGTYQHSGRGDDAPFVKIISPKSGSIVSGDVDIVVEGSDPQLCGKPKLNIYLDDYKADVLKEETSVYRWLTGSSQNGSYTITLEGVDKAGNISETSINLTLDNPAPEVYTPSSPIPTFNWLAMGDTKFRIYFSTDPNFGTILATSKKASKPWLNTPGWTPSQKDWNKIMGAAGSSPVRVYWKAIGKEVGLIHVGTFWVSR